MKFQFKRARLVIYYSYPFLQTEESKVPHNKEETA